MAEKRVYRRLAAILAADVAGYSRLMGSDELGTITRLKTLRSTIIDPAMEECLGRIVKTTGDGILMEFPSVVAAVECAVRVQGGMAKHNLDVPQDLRIEFRIGINLGDIVVDGDDILGDGVNVAARLEGLADAGGVLISGTVFDQVKGKLPFTFEDLGAKQVKNIADPVRVYRVVANETKSTERILALPDKPSIAVLPFQNMSGDPEQDYFVDGIVEDIITGLARIKWLFVIARNSSFVYKGRAVDVKQVGRELGVRYVLEGSMRKAGNRVRITGQLIEAATGAHIWAERYDRALDNIFDLQDEITMSVVAAIEPTLRQAEIERAKRKRPESLDAYDLYLRALPHLNAAMADTGGTALQLLDQALAIEPDYAAAHAASALGHAMRYDMLTHSEDDRAAALRHARAAIAAGADDATALAHGGFVLALLDRDYAKALAAIDRALALSNSSMAALGLGAVVRAWNGNAAQAIEHAERAIRLSPFDPMLWLPYMGLANAYYLSGRFEESAAAAAKAAQANPRFPIAPAMQITALSRLGRTEEAKSIARHLLEMQPGFTVSRFLASRSTMPPIYLSIAEALRATGLPE